MQVVQKYLPLMHYPLPHFVLKLTPNSWGQPGHRWSQTAGWCRKLSKGCWGSSSLNAPRTFYTHLRGTHTHTHNHHMLGHTLKREEQREKSPAEGNSLQLTFHTFVDRFIVGVGPSLGPLGGLDEQDGVGLQQDTRLAFKGILSRPDFTRFINSSFCYFTGSSKKMSDTNHVSA